MTISIYLCPRLHLHFNILKKSVLIYFDQTLHKKSLIAHNVQEHERKEIFFFKLHHSIVNIFYFCSFIWEEIFGFLFITSVYLC